MRGQVPPKRRFLQEPHGVTTQKTPFFIITAVKTSNLKLLTVFREFVSCGKTKSTKVVFKDVVKCRI
jgi:hypothetical protein